MLSTYEVLGATPDTSIKREKRRLLFRSWLSHCVGSGRSPPLSESVQSSANRGGRFLPLIVAFSISRKNVNKLALRSTKGPTDADYFVTP